MSEEANKNMEFYYKPWFVYLMIVVFFPVGLFLLWKSPAFTSKSRAVTTAVICVVVVLMGALGPKAEEKKAVNAPAQPAATEQAKKPVSKGLTNDEVGKYYSMTNSLLQDYYSGLAHKLGQGTPEVDASMLDFVCAPLDDSMVMAKGIFHLAGNDKINNDYVIRWRRSTKELIYLQINGKKLYYNDKVQDAAFADKDNAKK